MDFVHILDVTEEKPRSRTIERKITPDFVVLRSQDLLVRGKDFYAIWDDKNKLWSTDEYDVQRLVDEKLNEYIREHPNQEATLKVGYLASFTSGQWKKFKSYIASLADNAPLLDSRLVYANEDTTREMYASRRLPYSLEEGECPAFRELMETLYDEDERLKLLWSIGSIVEGDSTWLQKFVVLFGDPGGGKGTFLTIVQRLFEGYYTTFDAKALGSSASQFATEVFKSNPLVAIQHDGDLSRIEDNTRINSIVSHEEMTVNEKHKSMYTMSMNAFLFVGTNKPVKITDARSGVIRRLIDVHPSGRRIEARRYHSLMRKINSELGAIAWYCRQVYRDLGAHYYDGYKPIEMMAKTDVFFNFVESCQTELRDGIDLNRAWNLYRQYCDEALVEYKTPKYKFREELKAYYDSFEDRVQVDGQRYRGWYSGFRADKLKPIKNELTPGRYWLTMDSLESAFDDMAELYSAQYASDTGAPKAPWDKVTTKLCDLDRFERHYVRVPENHIVIDFDLKDENGDKSQKLNLEAASKWPETYAEWSQGGNGLHLHYIYDGDDELALEYAPGIEIKVFRGKASLRRRFSNSNGLPIAHIRDGLPRKKRKDLMIDKDFAITQDSIRRQVAANLRKEVHPATKPSMDFIKKITDEAYASGVTYDIRDMRPAILTFAMNSSNQKQVCLHIMQDLHLVSKDLEIEGDDPFGKSSNEPIVFFDVEVYPNLFVCCWKKDDPEAQVVSMINPTPQDVAPLLDMNLVGFNNRKYDNHILYARYLGYSNERLYDLSKRLISNSDKNATFREAYNLAYTDIYCFSTKKQSLKKWEIELGIHHQEMDIPWDEPVPEDRVHNVVEYCENDVEATLEVFHHLKEDWNARLVLSSIAGLPPSATTNACTQQIIFGDDRKPPFRHTKLNEMFPGYEYKFGKSTYKGEEVGEGGYVYAEPGFYRNVALLDIASMHPHSLYALKCFGEEHTERFYDIVKARMAIKHKDMNVARSLLDGALAPYLDGDLGALAYSLKIAINSVYGLTAAHFPNRCNGMDPSNNVDNIVAKRGALFMVDLKEFVQSKGFTVAHIKTDSIKIPDATPEIIEAVTEFGAKYGYTFEHEATYDRMCLVNDAVYIAHDDNGWHATGAQFQHPYVFKKLFLGEEPKIEDMTEVRQVQKGSLYLNYGNEDAPERSFVGRIGAFVPVKEDILGGTLEVLRDEKYSSAPRSKGYRWAIVGTESIDDGAVDHAYHKKLVNDAVKTLEKHCSMSELLAD